MKIKEKMPVQSFLIEEVELLQTEKLVETMDKGIHHFDVPDELGHCERGVTARFAVPRLRAKIYRPAPVVLRLTSTLLLC